MIQEVDEKRAAFQEQCTPLMHFLLSSSSVLNNCNNRNSPPYIDKLVETNAVCTEGVINYIYWFYKGQDNADMCKTILNRRCV